MKKEKINIIGAGLVGSVLAASLAQRGFDVRVYEKRPDLRKAGNIGGRSINLALSDRGWKALRIIGAEDLVRKEAIPMYGRMIHSESGELKFQAYGVGKQAIYSVSRGGLNAALISHAESKGARFEFENACRYFDPRKALIHLEKESIPTHDLTFGADGAFSKIRLGMMKQARFNYQQEYLEHGYKELTIPAGSNGKWQIEKNALHIWPRHSFMLIALPNADGSFTCTLFAPFEGENSFEKLKYDEELLQWFRKYFPDALPLMPELTKDFFRNPTSSLVTVRCYPWVQDKVALIGDAAHAIVPFFGQGMNAGFEDVSILDQLMDEEKEWSRVLDRYQKSRKADADAIADLAIKNFIEMRDRVADDQFLYRKKLEKKMHEAHPETYIPVYSLVTFSHVSYAEAQKIGQLQDRFFGERIPELFGKAEIDDGLIERLVEEWKNYGEVG